VVCPQAALFRYAPSPSEGEGEGDNKKTSEAQILQAGAPPLLPAAVRLLQACLRAVIKFDKYSSRTWAWVRRRRRREGLAALKHEVATAVDCGMFATGGVGVSASLSGQASQPGKSGLVGRKVWRQF
jgi:hypothetical protein